MDARLAAELAAHQGSDEEFVDEMFRLVLRRPLEVEARELVERAGADVVVLSGAATGAPPEAGFLEAVRNAIPASPRVLGSGLTAENAAALFPLVDGAIVGSDLKVDGVAANPVDPARVRALTSRVRELRAGIPA